MEIRTWKLIITRDISSIKLLSEFCEDYLRTLKSNAIILLEGPMAAGKSELVRQFVGTNSSSPTFALHHRYSLVEGRIDHWDLYRLKGDDELEGSGFWDLLAAEDSMVFIEWAEKIQESWFPVHRELIKIIFQVGQNSRKIFVYQAT